MRNYLISLGVAATLLQSCGIDPDKSAKKAAKNLAQSNEIRKIQEDLSKGDQSKSDISKFLNLFHDLIK